MHPRQFFLHRVRYLGLLTAYDYVDKKNPSHTLPYHSSEHCIDVATEAWMIYVSSDAEKSVYDEVVLILAGLFHDFNHSGGKKSDRDNNSHAINGFHKWLALVQPHEKQLIAQRTGIVIPDEIDIISPPDLVGRVEETIRVTEYPFVRQPTFFIQKCLRDADLLYSLNNLKRRRDIDLFLEIRKTHQDLNWDEFVIKQKAFLNNVEMFTAFGHNTFRRNIKRILERLDVPV